MIEVQKIIDRLAEIEAEAHERIASRDPALDEAQDNLRMVAALDEIMAVVRRLKRSRTHGKDGIRIEVALASWLTPEQTL